MYIIIQMCEELESSNQFLIEKIRENKPFLITRLGLGAETIIPYLMTCNLHVDKNYIHTLQNNAGILCENYVQLGEFAQTYEASLEHSSALACWDGDMGGLIQCQKFFIEKYNLRCIHFSVLEPFYCIEKQLQPWSHFLLGKKVLIVNPFTDSMQEQMRNGFQMYKDPDKKLFLDGQEFVFYKSYQTSGTNRIHGNWKETFKIMCQEIKQLDFDVALLGCGGYGLPLCDFIFTKMGKSAIYVGGGLQLLFGVMGNRWVDQPFWKEIVLKNNTRFIRPSVGEQVHHQNQIENGCYW